MVMKRIYEYLLGKSTQKIKDEYDLSKFPSKQIDINNFIEFFEYNGFIEITHKRGNIWYAELLHSNEASYTYVKHRTKAGVIFYEFAFKLQGEVSAKNMIYVCDVVEDEADLKNHEGGEAWYDGEVQTVWPAYKNFKATVIKNLGFEQ